MGRRNYEQEMLDLQNQVQTLLHTIEQQDREYLELDKQYRKVNTELWDIKTNSDKLSEAQSKELIECIRFVVEQLTAHYVRITTSTKPIYSIHDEHIEHYYANKIEFCNSIVAKLKENIK